MMLLLIEMTCFSQQPVLLLSLLSRKALQKHTYLPFGFSLYNQDHPAHHLFLIVNPNQRVQAMENRSCHFSN
ncbi:hypothetical protein ES705_20208 [subsurface metagenome]